MIPKIIIHGGAGKRPRNKTRIEKVRKTIKEVLERSRPILEERGALEAVVHAVSLLEDNPLFNAGTGSVLQADGKARLTASLMDGSTSKFSAVINVQNVKNPIRIAHLLQRERYCVLAGREALTFARAKGFRYFNPVTAERLRDWKRSQGMYGTVGAVAIDARGNIAAGTSTGGAGNATPGRASDVASTCGNYANSRVGISCTGAGESIVNLALAARIATRVTDGMKLQRAVEKSLKELERAGDKAGIVAVTKKGELFYFYNTEFMSYGFLEGDKLFTGK
jgi:L-asparaginase